MTHQLDGENYTIEEARYDAMDALHLLGNASSQISRTRRKKVLEVLNPNIQDLAVEGNLFKSAALHLFGDGFEQKMKDQAEAMKLLSKAKGPPPKKFFQGGHPTAPLKRWWPVKAGRETTMAEWKA